MSADITPEERCVSMEAEIRILRSQLAALQSVPQGVEVPEIMDELLTALEHLLEDTQHRDHDCGDEWCPVDVARRVVAKARLVPTPPQAAPGPAILNPPKQDRDCGDCTRLAICNGELACLCGPTGKMFDRKEPPHPLQPEERRVGPDEVVVDRNYLADLEESVIDTVEQLRVGFVLCENCGEQESTDTLDVMSMNLLPMIPRIEERRTSAQDHNGEGAR